MLVYNTPTLHTRMSNVVDVADPTAVLARAPDQDVIVDPQ